ncbi:hypothetical protein ASG43_12105 [Aureimonas sp. Leaf454]|uniref:four-carbon acid sugar kinase family protein n=1 Tax=Aureimonas sp. Leaf454 TaxID=1736381 RepID=UPI0006FF7958|nr:four-carbon acid sugar kinase family protein [Aureimonas sp. Leaf454]KQT46356.1 hypothetical protein ASG43_12105 [Aureimonas sp. Leaf454]
MSTARVVEAALADGLTIVADDLTGALDSAGAFAASGPVVVDLDGSRTTSARLCLDTDSRDGGLAQATTRTEAAFSRRRSGLWFKKVDSLLRGWPFDETCAAFRAGGFQRILFAPAFPDTGRVTTDGRQFIRTATGLRPVGPVFVEAFRSLGLRAAALADGDVEASCEVIVADIETNADFQRTVDALGRGVDDTLFVGSGGLAAALGGATRFIEEPVPEIAICGTNHPVTLTQIAIAADAGFEIVALDGTEPRWTAGPAVLVPPAQAEGSAHAARQIAQSLRRLAARPRPPRSAIVTGGATLRLLLDATSAGGLDCLGLQAPGIAVCRIRGGTWEGVTIVSKSGGFGPDSFLLSQFQGHGDDRSRNP